MATRLYLHSAGSPVISPAYDAGWEQTGQATRLPMDVKRQVAALTARANSSSITVPITTTQQIACYQFVSRQVFKPVRLDNSTLFSLVIRTSENATTNNAFIAYSLRALSEDGGTVLATLISKLASGGTEYPVHASTATRIISQTAITPATLSVPWRLCLEIGAHANAPSAAGNFRLRAGCDAASDFALTSALTTDLNPWMELSAELNAVAFGNYHGVRVGDGLSTGERIR